MKKYKCEECKCKFQIAQDGLYKQPACPMCQGKPILLRGGGGE